LSLNCPLVLALRVKSFYVLLELPPAKSTIIQKAKHNIARKYAGNDASLLLTIPLQAEYYAIRTFVGTCAGFWRIAIGFQRSDQGRNAG
jgi:hypothetical protein